MSLGVVVKVALGHCRPVGGLWLGLVQLVGRPAGPKDPILGSCGRRAVDVTLGDDGDLSPSNSSPSMACCCKVIPLANERTLLGGFEMSSRGCIDSNISWLGWSSEDRLLTGPSRGSSAESD